MIERAAAPRAATADDASKRETPGHLFLDRVRDTLRRHRMLVGGETVVVAASGGPDSTALVHALATIGRDLGLSVHVAHLDHRLRPEAAADAAFVADVSRALGLPHHQDFADPKTLAAQDRLSLEDASRRLRYEFLVRVARDVGATVVVTGHNLDDQAETVLMRLLRGSGMDGLAGIPPVRQSGGIQFVRPLIETTRAEVESYLRAIGAGWREDSTNRDLSFLRNRIRLVLLPALEGYNPDVRRTLARVASLLRDEAEAIEVLAAASIGQTLSGDAGAVHVALEPFTRLPVALQRRALREAVRRVRGNTRAVRFVHIEWGRRLVLQGEVGSWIPLPGGARITRLTRGAEVAMEPAGPAPGVYRLAVPGRVVAIEFGVHVTAEVMTRDQLAAAGPDARGKDAVVLDAVKVGSELVLRGPQPGDRFAPAGMGGRTKTLADYLRDEKVPRHRRAAIPVLATTDGVIVWIVGMRGSEVGRITPATTRAVRIVAWRLRA